ncbi:MAG: hypothetical protein ACT4NU_09420 [Chromatiales bacterium]
MGNRTAENAYDPAGTLTQTRARLFNELNRLAQDLGGVAGQSKRSLGGAQRNPG